MQQTKDRKLKQHYNKKFMEALRKTSSPLLQGMENKEK